LYGDNGLPIRSTRQNNPQRKNAARDWAAFDVKRVEDV
jgi:hypothetical protein